MSMEQVNNWCQSHNYWPRKIALGVVILGVLFWICGGGHQYNRNDIQKDTITVSGKGEVMAQPDIATISFSVLVENKDVGIAQNEAATKMNSIIASLESTGVERKDIKTTNYNIYPRYDYIKNAVDSYYGGKQVLAGYDVSQTVSVKIRKIADAGTILANVGKLGVTDVSGLNFGIDKEDEVKIKARDLAVEDAKTQAKNLARSLGVRLVKITAFSESNNYPVYYDRMMSSKGISEASSVVPDLPTGENKITSNVSITYEIR